MCLISVDFSPHFEKLAYTLRMQDAVGLLTAKDTPAAALVVFQKTSEKE